MQSPVAAALIDNCGEDLGESEFVQDTAEIPAVEERSTRINAVMTAIFDRLPE